jgi:hypothetical protein
LYGAIRLEHVTKVAAYEPLLFAGQEGIEDYQRVFSAMQAKLRAGHNGDALIYSTQETATLATRRGQFSAWAASMLRSIPTHDDHVAWQDLLPALAPALDLVKLSEGTLDDYRHLAADVLLMYGSESDTVFADTADALHGVLPRSTVIQLRDATTTPRRPTANPTVSPTSCGCSSRSDAPGKGDALPGFDEPAVVCAQNDGVGRGGPLSHDGRMGQAKLTEQAHRNRLALAQRAPGMGLWAGFTTADEFVGFWLLRPRNLGNRGSNADNLRAGLSSRRFPS